MELSTEVAQLKAEVAALREAVDALKYFLHIEPVGTTSELGAGLHIRCTSLAVCHPDAPLDPKGMQALLCAGREGPTFSLNGGDMKPRLTLSATNEQARLELFGTEMRQAVLIHSDDADAQGLVEVLDAGKPRAILRAIDNAGVVSALYGDGEARVVLRGDAKGGDLLVVDANQKTSVKLSSDSPEGGNVIVHSKLGQPAALISSHDGDGVIVAFSPKKNVACSLRSTPQGGALMLVNAEEKPTVSLYSNKLGGFVRVHDAAGKTTAELTAEAHGGALILNDLAARERAVLRQVAEGPMLTLRAGDKKPVATLGGHGGDGALLLYNPAGAVTGLQMHAKGGAITMTDAGKNNQIFAGFEENNSFILLQAKDGGSAPVAICTQPQGGLVMVSAPDGVRRAGVAATPEGGQLSVFNDLGIERALIGSMNDGGTLKLNWGGTVGVAATATDQGGRVMVMDAEGNPGPSLPPTVESD